MAQALLDIEHALQDLGLWSAEPLALERLHSTAPFCVDTLGFHEWLQWIFIPRMRNVVARQQRLPSSARIMPMGEQCFAHLGRRQQPLLELLSQVDRLSQKLV